MIEQVIRILLVEDGEIQQRVAVRLFKMLGFDVDVASDGRAALTLTTKNIYDIILVDIGLPDIDGFEVTRHIRNSATENQSAQILALTAHSDVATKKQATESGVDGFIVKPLTLDICKKLTSTSL